MALVFIFGVIAAAIFFYFEVNETSEDIGERWLQGQAHDLLAGLRLERERDVIITPPPDWAAVYGQVGSGFSFTLYDANGVPVAVSENLADPLPFLAVPEAEIFGETWFSGVGAGQRATLAARAPEGYILVVGRDRPDLEMLAESFLVEESLEQFVIFVPFLLGSLLLIWLVSGWSLRPLSHASKDAAAIGPANLSARIETHRLPAEVRPLVDAVNGALERLAHAYLAERRLTANAAHELRTPLAVLSLRLQRARGGAVDWPEIEKDVARLTRIVAQLMDLARKDSSARTSNLSDTKVNLARVLREAAAQVLPLAEDADRSLDVDAFEAVEILGHGDDLRDMIVNLLYNALVHGMGDISLTLRIESCDGVRQAVIEVEDDGPGLPDDFKGVAFDRFRKGQSSSAGAGLGLSIVRQVARNHGGDAAFPPGPGSRVRVTLPLMKVAGDSA